jgi:hypothetical protein
MQQASNKAVHGGWLVGHFRVSLGIFRLPAVSHLALAVSGNRDSNYLRIRQYEGTEPSALNTFLTSGVVNTASWATPIQPLVYLHNYIRYSVYSAIPATEHVPRGCSSLGRQSSPR